MPLEGELLNNNVTRVATTKFFVHNYWKKNNETLHKAVTTTDNHKQKTPTRFLLSFLL